MRKQYQSITIDNGLWGTFHWLELLSKVNVQRSLHTFNTTTELRPLSKAQNPQLLPGCRGINGCPLLQVCVHYSLLCVYTWVGYMQSTNSEYGPYLHKVSMYYLDNLNCLIV